MEIRQMSSDDIRKGMAALEIGQSFYVPVANVGMARFLVTTEGRKNNAKYQSKLCRADGTIEIRRKA